MHGPLQDNKLKRFKRVSAEMQTCSSSSKLPNKRWSAEAPLGDESPVSSAIMEATS